MTSKEVVPVRNPTSNGGVFLILHILVNMCCYLDEEGTLVATSHFHQNDGDTEETDFVAKTNQYTKKRWKMQTPPVKEGSRLMRFAARTLTHSFCISGMGFQDAWNIDLGRLKGCCVHIVTGRGELIPFCAFHLTSKAGERLYQNEEEST